MDEEYSKWPIELNSSLVSVSMQEKQSVMCVSLVNSVGPQMKDSQMVLHVSTTRSSWRARTNGRGDRKKKRGGSSTTTLEDCV